MPRRVLGAAHFGRPLDRLPGLAPPRDVRPRRHSHPANAERGASQDIADEMHTEHDPRERHDADDHHDRDDGGDAAAAGQEAKDDLTALVSTTFIPPWGMNVSRPYAARCWAAFRPSPRKHARSGVRGCDVSP